MSDLQFGLEQAVSGRVNPGDAFSGGQKFGRHYVYHKGVLQNGQAGLSGYGLL